MVTSVVVAVDGTSGSGKSSTSRGVASRLGLRYLDTGAQFRAMTWWLLREGVDVRDAAAVAERVEEPEIVAGTDPLQPSIAVDDVDVAEAIRTDEVDAAVSPVSAVPEVRARLLELQRRVIGAGGIVVEGRDIGTVVLPDATLKVYLTAAPEVRAQRRAGQLGLTQAAEIADLAADLRRRDEYDSSRVDSPLRPAADAVVVDSTELDREAVVAAVVELAASAVGAGNPS